jgi:Peptidase_C39 like family
MTTGLWVTASGLPSSELALAIPPACRRHVEAPANAAVEHDGGDVVVAGAEWSVSGATHFVPSLAALTPLSYGVRLELAVRTGGAWSPFVAGVSLGGASFAPLAATDGLDVDVDVFRTRAPAEAARLRFRLKADEASALLANRWMLTLSASDTVSGRPVAAAARPALRLEVPPRSQMDAERVIADRICSPTCVAMVLDYWRRPPVLGELAAEMFHSGTDLYGVWPAAIMAASRRDLGGYLLRFPDWSAAAWCLSRGLPIVASVRYAAGELTGAAVAETPGHLIVLTGWAGEYVLVNDPAAPGIPTVPRRYRLDELTRIWLDRTGIGYVIFPVR